MCCANFQKQKKKKSYWKRWGFTLNWHREQVHRGKTAGLEVPREAEKCIARSTVTCRTMEFFNSLGC